MSRPFALTMRNAAIVDHERLFMGDDEAIASSPGCTAGRRAGPAPSLDRARAETMDFDMTCPRHHFIPVVRPPVTDRGDR